MKLEQELEEQPLCFEASYNGSRKWLQLAKDYYRAILWGYMHTVAKCARKHYTAWLPRTSFRQLWWSRLCNLGVFEQPSYSCFSLLWLRATAGLQAGQPTASLGIYPGGQLYHPWVVVHTAILVIYLVTHLCQGLIRASKASPCMSTKLYFHPWYMYDYMFGTCVLPQISICLSKMAVDPAALSYRQRLCMRACVCVAVCSPSNALYSTTLCLTDTQ